MELTQLHRQGSCQDTEQSPKLTINDLPDELLVEIFDFYRQSNVDSYQWWSIKLEWFKLIHVCKRWRAVMFASSSRLDLCFVLLRNKGGNMKAIMSRHFPPLPIDINYEYHRSVKTKDMGRMVAALKRPDRIRGIALTGSTSNLDKFFQATNCPFPALKSLALALHAHYDELKIPATFLKGSNLHLRTLELHSISLPSISRLLSSAPALINLTLEINSHIGPIPATSLLLSHFQGMPRLRCLNLHINSSIDDRMQPTKPKNIFTHSKLTRFRYTGCSAFLNALLAGFSAPSLQDVDIDFYYEISPPIMHLTRFIEDIGERYHTVQVVVKSDDFHFLLLGRSEYDVPRFKSTSDLPGGSIMHMSSAFSARLTTTEELCIVLLATADDLRENIPWRRFLLHFPCVKALRLEGRNNLPIASALHQDGEEPNIAYLPALEEIELCVSSITTPQLSLELEAFQPFISARQRAGLPVRVYFTLGHAGTGL